MTTRMRKLGVLYLTLSLLLISSIGLTQSINLYFGVPFYFLNGQEYSYTKINNDFNYNIGLNYLKQIRANNLSFGIGYQTKNYTIEYVDQSFDVAKTSYEVSSVNIPIVFYKNLIKKERNDFYILAGMKFIFPLDVIQQSWDKAGQFKLEELDAETRIGSAIRFGCMYSYDLSAKIGLFVEVSGEYKFINEFHDDHITSNSYVPLDDRFLVNLNLGIEWRFKQ